uniref:Uncharacterized protein n=1 Tax=Romanomermis culicivorax TaxID=13658 RepID=A0A915JRQ5_ROMCU
MAASFDDTSFENSEALFNINGEDTYFGNVFEADFLKSDSLSLGKTARNDVGYGTYLLHYILGSILSLPHTRLLEKLSIEDMFFKLESIDSDVPNVIKVFTTFEAVTGKKYLHYHLFDFEEKDLFRSAEKLTKRDLTELSRKLREKGKNQGGYSLSRAKHLKIFKPSTWRPYEVTEEWRNEGSDIAILDIFSVIPSEKSPVVAKESLIPLAHLEHYVPEDFVAESKLIDAMDHLSSEKILFPRVDQGPDLFRRQLTEMFTKLATIYRTYDLKYNLKLSTSRVDHCGFIHGALNMNLKNYHKISLHVENIEMNHHDCTKMVITSNSEDILHRMTQRPILVDFRDFDTARATVKATEFVLNKKAVELPPYIQTLTEECFYAAVCLTSMNSPVSIISIRTEPKPNAERSMYESQRKAFEDKLYKAFDIVQSREKLTDMKNLRCLSRYIMGEAGSYNENQHSPKIYLRQERQILVEPVNIVSSNPELIEESIRKLPSVNIHDLISNVDHVVFPSAERSNHLAAFFHESQKLIDNADELVSIIKGMFSSQISIHQNVKPTTGDGTAGCQVIPFKKEEYHSITEKDRQLSMTSGDGMFYNFLTLLAKASNVATCSYNVIFNKKGKKSSNNVIITRMDYNSNLKNFKQLLQGCMKFDGIARSKRSDICELPYDENAKLIDPNAKLTKPSRFQLNLKTVQKVSMVTVHGMIIKDMITNIFDGDFEGLCFNMGFVAGGFAASHLADKIFGLGTRLIGVGKSYLGQALTLSSPFLRRTTSVLITYDLLNSIQKYRNNDTEALADITEDGVFLSIDAVDIGVEIAEAFGIVEELSAITGPIGLGVSAVAMIGGEIYR